MTTSLPDATFSTSGLDVQSSRDSPAPATPKQLARLCLLHSQTLLGAAVLQFNLIFILIAVRLTTDFDHGQSDQAFNLIQLQVMTFFGFGFACFGLGMWLLVRSGVFNLSKTKVRHTKELWAKSAVVRWIIRGFIGVCCSAAVGIITVSWLRLQKLVSDSFADGTMLAFTSFVSVVLILGACLRIQQAMKFQFEDGMGL